MKAERVIVLSWVQNLFQIFKKDDVDDEREYIDYDLHYHKSEHTPIEEQHQGSKELDARISYQYPKTAEPYSVILKETQKNIVHQKSKKEKVLHHHERKHQQTEVVHASKKEQPKAKKELTHKISRPFHPTEIPSPVFGFNRPKPSDALIEHELCHFPNSVVTEPIVHLEAKQEPEFEMALPPQDAVEQITVEDFPVSLVTTEEADEDSKAQVLPEPVHRTRTSTTLQEPVAEQETVDQPESVEQAESVEETRPERSKRRHLPFNVMMLKQDKRILDERKPGSRAEQRRRNLQSEMVVAPPKETVVVHEEQKVEDELPIQNEYYKFPAGSLLKPPVFVANDSGWVQSQQELLDETLQNFNVGAHVVNVTQGPAVTRFEVQPDPGVKVNKITNLSDDIKLSLAARDIRIEAPIPGKHTIGIEVPNAKSRPVFIKEIIETNVFKESVSPLTAVLGLDIAGKPVVTDLRKMPHGLIAGATGSGKSVCINSILVSLLYKASPKDLKLMLIDPKMVELAPYNRIPHLVSPVITDVKAATAALKWAVEEMERRYELFAHTGVRDIKRFNELAVQHKQYSDKLPYMVIVIDELADLMMMSPADVEEAICRIAQKARACGIHLLIATQRPSVDVITGLIKANIPTRIAFSVSSQVDSRTIIDISGAEKLLGRGDMLFLENGSSKPVRLQGTYVSDEEIDLVVDHVRREQEPEYLFQQEELLKKAQVTEEEDELFYDACEFIIDQGGASTSSLQRRFKIGYNRAARLMDLLETHGYITGSNGSKAREVLITEADLESMQETVTI